MVKRLSLYAKTRITRLHSSGASQKTILDDLRKDGIIVTRRTVRLFLKKYEQTGSFADRPRSGRPCKFPEGLNKLVSDLYENDDELSAHDVSVILHEIFKISVSAAHIRRIRRKVGLVRSRPSYCQIVREKNRVDRLNFCLEAQRRGDTFDDVIFTDESSIEMERHGKLCFRQKNAPRKLKPKAKHPVKLHVWAGISKRGKTPILVFQDTMDGDFYRKEILQETLLPFLNRRFPDGHRFQQDNDPKHCAKATKEFMEQAGINWMKFPAESPDLNCIENVWHEMKHFLRRTVKPTKKEELVQGIHLFWRTRVTVESCTRYINHIQKVIPEVIRNEGRASGY